MATQKWKLYPVDRKIRAVLNGQTVAETTQAVLLIEHPGELHYYFPKTDVHSEYLVEADYTEKSGYRGVSQYWSLNVDGKISENGAWTYPKTKENRPDVSEYIAFKHDAIDEWYEEAEQVFGHPRNPYHRVDAIHSSRHIKVVIDGETIADSHNPVLVSETGLTTRYYLPPTDVNQDYLTANDTSSICPYKGTASYWSVNVNGKPYDNIVWAYENPLEEQPKLKGLQAFWTEKDKAIQLYVDGELA